MLAKFDLTRRTFGYLEVLEFAGTDKRGETLWLCQCHYNGCTNTKIGALPIETVEVDL